MVKLQDDARLGVSVDQFIDLFLINTEDTSDEESDSDYVILLKLKQSFRPPGNTYIKNKK